MTLYAIKGGKTDRPHIYSEPPTWHFAGEKHHGTEGFTGKPKTWTHPAGWTHPKVSWARCYDARQLTPEAEVELHRLSEEIDRLQRERRAYIDAHFLEWPIADRGTE